MENCIHAWSPLPHRQKNIQCLESVQRGCELLLNWFLVYESWVTSIICRHFVLRLYMTEESGEILSRRSRYWMVSREYQVISSFSYTQVKQSLYKRVQHETSSGQDSTVDTRKYFYSQRVVHHWNGLPQSVVQATSVNSFKRRLDNSTRYGQKLCIKGTA